MTKLTTILFLLMCLNGYGQTKADNQQNVKLVGYYHPDMKKKYFFVSYMAGDGQRSISNGFPLKLNDYPSFDEIRVWCELDAKEYLTDVNSLVVISISELTYEFYQALKFNSNFIKPGQND